ncbi:Gfo/Idh/MocA family oxidoreductase [Lignipirellula cremea]|uniref:Gfo/Idh/MocA-like oxidoreductase N-terminal domain-containing protein n=1 Tax=Lignipirellula cremea TaxID=2528010 RepID=A0A518DVQ1_9BACT|nr:hypothetical protein [Lignipirellula cremea]QDU95914.1 hypothetical protein Pla8534_37330 [Lignipirellula cremea]
MASFAAHWTLEQEHLARMRFALLGFDEETTPLLQAILASPQHSLTAVAAVGPAWTSTYPRFPGQHLTWEELLVESDIDAVLVGASFLPEADLCLPQLAASGKPMLIAHPACEAIEALHLDMIQADVRAPLIPFSPGALHPAIARLRDLCQAPDSPLGNVDQIVFERGVPFPGERKESERPADRILRQLTCDALLVHQVIGEIERVSAMGDATSLANLQVTMESPPRLARWSTLPLVKGAVLRLIGSAGSAELRMQNDPSEWELSINSQPAEQFPCYVEPIATLQHFEECVAAAADPASWGKNAWPPLSWSEACVALEVAETTRDSLRRGKAIPMRRHRPSEQDTFKGIMAAGGCGFLMLTLALFMLAMLIDGFHPPFRDHLLWRLWPAYVLAPLLVFLLLQSLQFVFVSPGGENQAIQANLDESPASDK